MLRLTPAKQSNADLASVNAQVVQQVLRRLEQALDRRLQAWQGRGEGDSKGDFLGVPWQGREQNPVHSLAEVPRRMLDAPQRSSCVGFAKAVLGGGGWLTLAKML